MWTQKQETTWKYIRKEIEVAIILPPVIHFWFVHQYSKQVISQLIWRPHMQSEFIWLLLFTSIHFGIHWYSWLELRVELGELVKFLMDEVLAN